jgi:hypothetical protein
VSEEGAACKTADGSERLQVSEPRKAFAFGREKLTYQSQSQTLSSPFDAHILREELLHSIIDGSCIARARGVLQKGKLRPESESERETGEKKAAR